MLEPPDLPDATLLAALQASYGLQAATLAFLPLGNDPASFVYRAEASGRAYFVKLRASAGFREASLAVPRCLADQGVPHILAPLRTLGGALWTTVEQFALSLYPYLDAQAGADVGLPPGGWRTLGAVTRQFHAVALPPSLAAVVPRERFVPGGRDRLSQLRALVQAPRQPTAEARELAECWRARQREIDAVVQHADDLGRRLRAAPPGPHVLCHADLHTWNVLVDAEQQLWLVDWDEAVLALKERDLMFVVGGLSAGLVSEADTAEFFEGYGRASVDPSALAYYRCAWAVQDLVAYATQVLLGPEAGEITRREAVRGFKSLFAPGQIVPLALASVSG